MPWTNTAVAHRTRSINEKLLNWDTTYDSHVTLSRGPCLTPKKITDYEAVRHAPYGENGSYSKDYPSPTYDEDRLERPPPSSMPGTTFAASLSSASSLISSSSLTAVHPQAMIMVYDIDPLNPKRNAQVITHDEKRRSGYKTRPPKSINACLICIQTRHAFRDVKLVYHIKGHPCILIESWYHILNPQFLCRTKPAQFLTSTNLQSIPQPLYHSSFDLFRHLFERSLPGEASTADTCSHNAFADHTGTPLPFSRQASEGLSFGRGCSYATVVEFVFAGNGNSGDNFMLGSLSASSLGTLTLRELGRPKRAKAYTDLGIGNAFHPLMRVSRERCLMSGFGYVKYNSHITQPTLQGVVRGWPIRRMHSGITDIDNALNENATSQRRYRSRKTRIGFRERTGSDGDVDDDSGYLESSLASRKWYPESSEYIQKHEWNRRKWFIGGPLGLCSASMLQDDLVMKVAQNVLQTRLEGERGGIPVGTAKRPSTSFHEVVLQISPAWLETRILLPLPLVGRSSVLSVAEPESERGLGDQSLLGRD
ncbi:hypothetical protein FB446DRAFT_704391 [Lentinula raphanica]|nr:hypothetical protein FB446DRAFT_704391 [Lentinula raphanica]